jgi:hypothetical protein
VLKWPHKFGFLGGAQYIWPDSLCSFCSRARECSSQVPELWKRLFYAAFIAQ